MELEFDEYTFKTNVRNMSCNQLKALNAYYYYPKSPSRKLLLSNIRKIRSEYEQRIPNDEQTDEQIIECSLCEYALQKSYTITLKCKHTFCDICILRHIREYDHCPTCNKRCNYFDVLIGLKYKHYYESKKDDIVEVESVETEVESVETEDESISEQENSLSDQKDVYDNECEYTTMLFLVCAVIFMFYINASIIEPYQGY